MIKHSSREAAQFVVIKFPEIHLIFSGAIIGDGDRSIVIVLGLAPGYGTTFFLFLEQIAPSPSTHARICCEDFAGDAQEKWRPKFPKSFRLLTQNSRRLCLL